MQKVQDIHMHFKQLNLTAFNKIFLLLQKYKCVMCACMYSIWIIYFYYLSTLQCSDESAALTGAGTHRLSPALTEQTGHRRFVG